MIGPHVTKTHADPKSGISAHIQVASKQAKDKGIVMTATSIFITGPRSYSINFDETEAKAVRKVITDNNITLISHTSYYNLPWDQKPVVMKSLGNEIKMAKLCGAIGIVIHVGQSVSIDKIVNAMSKLYNKDITLYLEPTAQQPKKAFYADTKNINALFTSLKEKKITNIGFCVDTAHLWSSGVALDSPSQWFNALPNVPIMIHLNDSKAEFGKGKDLHDSLLFGNIWKKTPSGLVWILEYAKSNKIPMILERGSANLDVDYAVLRKLGWY